MPAKATAITGGMRSAGARTPAFRFLRTAGGDANATPRPKGDCHTCVHDQAETPVETPLV